MVEKKWDLPPIMDHFVAVNMYTAVAVMPGAFKITYSHSLNTMLGLLPLNLLIKNDAARIMLRPIQHCIHGRVITGTHI